MKMSMGHLFILVLTTFGKIHHLKCNKNVLSVSASSSSSDLLSLFFAEVKLQKKPEQQRRVCVCVLTPCRTWKLPPPSSRSSSKSTPTLGRKQAEEYKAWCEVPTHELQKLRNSWQHLWASLMRLFFWFVWWLDSPPPMFGQKRKVCKTTISNRKKMPSKANQ